MKNLIKSHVKHEEVSAFHSNVQLDGNCQVDTLQKMKTSPCHTPGEVLASWGSTGQIERCQVHTMQCLVRHGGGGETNDV